jgi:hypothetical protein
MINIYISDYRFFYMAEKQYSIAEKNGMFKKIQDFVKNKSLTKQNMVDLHDILVDGKPSYSHNKNGTLYMSSKYNDKTYQRIEEFIDWVEKNQQSKLSRFKHSDKQKEAADSMMFQSSTNSDAAADDSKIDIEKRFGTHKMFKSQPQASFKFKYQKPEDVTKKNEMFKRLTKRSKKISQIPIHHTHKQITSYAYSFEMSENKHASQLWFVEDKDADDADDAGDADEYLEKSSEDDDGNDESSNEESLYYEDEEDEDEEDEVELDDDIELDDDASE